MQAGKKRIVAWMALCAVLVGCEVGPDFQRPAPPTVDRYTENELPAQTVTAHGPGGLAQHFIDGRDIPADWWSLFHSDALTALVQTALQDNPNLDAARASLRQAQELVLESQASYLPSLSSSFSSEREKISGAAFGFPGLNSTLTLYTANANVSYTFDVWGGIRRTVEEQQAAAEYQAFELEATYLTLAGNVVTTAISEASLRAQIAAEQEIIAFEQQQLQTVQQQFQLGGATGSDVATQQSQLAATFATLAPLESQLGQTRNQMAAYLGSLPSRAHLPVFDLDSITLPENLPLSLPSQLVAQRPDIRAAEAQLHSATAAVGIAIANRLPQLTLSAAGGSEALLFDSLFGPGTMVWSVTSQLTQPLFEGGLLLHRQRAAVAFAQQATANYKNVVITAFQNVANALVALQQDAMALKANLAAEQAAKTSLDLAQSQYRLGGIAYLTVLTDEQAYRSALINLVKARASRYADTAALFQALGGGWWNRSDLPPAPDGLLKSLLP